MIAPGMHETRDHYAVRGGGHPAMAVRPLLVADLEAVVKLERCCYRAPWSRSMLRGELLREDGVQLGALREGDVVGALFAALLGGPWHVMNVSVDPVERRRGVATRLLAGFFERTSACDDEGYTLEVRAGNTAAIELYGCHGFVSAGIRRGYYADNGEDGIVMWRPPQRVLDVRAQRPDVPGAQWEPAT